MKKLFVLALLSIAFNAMAEDYFLYWMVDEGAKLDGKSFEENTYYAKVKTDGGSYLSFYTSPDAADSYGNVYTVDLTDSMPTFADVFGGTGNIPSSFIIELYNDSGCADGSWVGKATLAYNPANITTPGMGNPPGIASASSFTAAPEPTSGMLLLLGVAGLALRRKNKKA